MQRGEALVLILLLEVGLALAAGESEIPRRSLVSLGEGIFETEDRAVNAPSEVAPKLPPPLYRFAEATDASRALLQTADDARSAVADYVCNLQESEIDAFYERSARRWTIDNDGMDAIDNDLQTIVNCSRRGDLILLDVTQSIQLTARVVIPWNLTISTTLEDASQQNGVVPETERKTVLTCPSQNQGAFLILDTDATLANVMFRNCSLHADRGDVAIVEVDGCSDDREHNIALYHVTFRRNTLSGAAGVRFTTPSCHSLEMVDVAFVRNSCSGNCGVHLAARNRLRNVILEGNEGQRSATEVQPWIVAPESSTTDATFITAEGNQGGIFHIINSNLTLSNSTLADNEVDGGAESNGGCLSLLDSTAVVARCTFRGNRGATGASMHLVRSNVTLVESVLKRGSAANGGCIRARSDASLTIINSTMTACAANLTGGGIFLEQSTLSASNSAFRLNRAKGNGAAVALTSSSANFTNTTFMRNSADINGGAIYSGEEGIIQIVNSAFQNNRAQLGGAILVEESTEIAIQASQFRNNVAEISGADAYFQQSIARITFCQFNQSQSRFGGSIHARTASDVRVADNIFGACQGEEGGCIQAQSNTSVTIVNTTMDRAQATESGGAIHLSDIPTATIRQTVLSANVAQEDGGALLASATALDVSEVRVIGNEARGRGGGFYCADASTIRSADAQFHNNTAQNGGTLFLSRNTTGSFRQDSFMHNEAQQDGGAIFMDQSQVNLTEARVEGNSAEGGGSLKLEQRSTVRISDSEFRFGETRGSGAFVYADDSAVIIDDVRMFNGNSSGFGGAFMLRNSSIDAFRLHVANCLAQKDGGAMELNSSSTLLCSRCTLENNEAVLRGGAVSIDTTPGRSLVFQFDQSTIQNNTADCGGCINYISGRQAGCNQTDTTCTLLAISETVMRNCIAKSAGGGIIATDLAAIRFTCRQSLLDSPKREFYSIDELASMQVLRGLDDICPDWTGNDAGIYGDTLASYAKNIRKTLLDDRDEMLETTTDNAITISNHSSGDRLPRIFLQLIDEYGQAPAALTMMTVPIDANLTSPDGFFPGLVRMELSGNEGNFSNVVGFQPPGNYTVRIDFSRRFIPFVITVEIRQCSLGEEATRSNTLCTPCNTATYNVNEEQCQPCPDNAICETASIRPKKGYWHPSPCSNQMQRCMTPSSCDTQDRDSTLAGMTAHVRSCDLSDDFIRNYTSAQCKKGHRGHLCGSCDEDYGKSRSFTCTRCPSEVGSFFLIILVLLILLGLCGFTVRTNLTSAVKTLRPTTRSPNLPNQQPATAPDRPALNEHLVEMLYVGHVPREARRRQLRPATTPEQEAKKSELAKWKAVELFKITVNYLQVTAVAVSIKVEWTAVMIAMFETAEVVGGVTSEATNRSIECMFSDDASVERSILGSTIDVLMPFIVVGLFIAFWSGARLRYRETPAYLVKRTVLSAIAVFYISYISLTKSFLNILNCVEVHDSRDVDDDSASRYWAMDTTLTCYEGSHAALAAVLGWPLLIGFTFGFPIVIALVVMKLAVEQDFRKGWIYDTAGFMYRSYRHQFVFWESIVMLRKAVLAVVIVFSYPLGPSLQCVLSVLVLTLASYCQTLCRPFRKEFDVLNEMEGASLLVSLITFVSSLVYDSERVPDAVLKTVTAGIFLLNVALFLFFFVFFVILSASYLKTVLDIKGVDYDPDGGTLHIIKVYISKIMLAETKERLLRRRKNNGAVQTA